MPASATTFSGLTSSVLKKIWPQSEIQNLMYEDSPLHAFTNKDTSWTGNTREIIMQYANGGGHSPDFTVAKETKSTNQFGKMSVELADLYALWSVEHKAILASRTDKGAVVKALENATKGALKKVKRDVCWMLHGNGGGSIGRLASTTSGTSLIFREARTLRNIEIGDYLQLASDDGRAGAGVRAGDALKVTAKDVENLTVTVDQAYTTAIPTATTSDYVFLKGFYGAAMEGLETYVPESAPGVGDVPTSVWGMSRTADTRRLGGIRVGGRGLLIQDAIKKALKVARDESASTDLILMSTDDFYSLESSLGSSVQRVQRKVAEVGFDGVKFVAGGSKPIEVYMDPDCKANIVWLLQTDTWTMSSMGDYPDFLGMNGERFIQEEASPTFEGRVGGYGQFYCDAPGYNVRLDLTAA